MTSIASWMAAWDTFNVSPSSELRDLHANVIARYSEPHRSYHTLQHLSECFEHWSAIRGIVPHPGEVEIALWFHDAIYDTHRNDNEVQSAALAEEWARHFGVPDDSVHRIRELILATRHAAAPVGIDAQALVDVDLSIFGSEPERFGEYERQVRQEYFWVPEAIFRTRRAGILREFLARPSIYSTVVFRERNEEQARNNLQRSLARLK